MNYLTSSSPSVPANSTRTVLTFLRSNTSPSNEAWVLARAGHGSSGGGVRVRLVDQFGTPLSGVTEVFGSTLSRIKLLNVNIPGSGNFPEVIRLSVQNTSSDGGDAFVEGLLV